MARLSLLFASVLYLFSSVSADASVNYTSQLLSSGYINLGDWQTAFDKAQALVSSLSTSDKISIVSAGSGGNFTALKFKDSSSSILSMFYVTTWPAPISMAHSWDKSMVYDQSVALGGEMKGKGINIANAPTAQPLGRSPWGGRIGETYGPDTFLNGVLFGQATKGISDAGVVPAGKHWLLNEQETNRMETSSISDNASKGNLTTAYSSNADDKTTHETYLWGFYDAVKNGLGGVMCAMNQVNNSFSCENQDILAGFLKSELGFPGLVYGDVGAQKTALNSANAGLDYGSSSYWSNATMNAGLNNGSLTTARLDDMVIRNVIVYYKQEQDSGYPAVAAAGDYVDSRGNNSKLAREYAANSLVLLKNTNNALPLSAPKKVAIFGLHAGSAVIGPNTPMDVKGGADSVFQGHMAQVGGSGQGSFSYLVTPVYAFTTKSMEDGTMLRMMLNDSIVTSSASIVTKRQESDNSTSSSSGGIGGGSSYSDSTAASQTTLDYAYNQDACVVFINAYSGEGGDRSELYNDDQDALINEVASNCNNTIVVINTTGPRLLDNFVTNENVTAVVYGGALGQESGNAIIDVLYGAVNPSGKLAHTIAKNESDYNVEIDYNANITFSEGNYIDYKYLDKYNVTPRYEFGYGLSYTTFNYSSTVGVSSNITAGAATGVRSVGGREDLWDTVATVSTSISNSGSLAGSEVAQLYVAFPDAADAPVKQLRGFEKVAIAAGDSATVSFGLHRRDLSYWDVSGQEWTVAPGTYTFYVGASSRDIKSQNTLTV